LIDKHIITSNIGSTRLNTKYEVDSHFGENTLAWSKNVRASSRIIGIQNEAKKCEVGKCTQSSQG
jgi:hypothetical protein